MRNKRITNKEFYKNLITNYIFITPLSYKNCLTKAFLINNIFHNNKKNQFYHSQQICKLASKLIVKLEINTDESYKIALEKLCKHYKLNAEVYYLYEEVCEQKEFNYGFENSIKLLFESTHAILILNKQFENDKRLSMIDKEMIWNINENKTQRIKKKDFKTIEMKNDEKFNKFYDLAQKINNKLTIDKQLIMSNYKDLITIKNELNKTANEEQKKSIEKFNFFDTEYDLLTFDIESFNVKKIIDEVEKTQRQTYLIGCWNEKYEYFYFEDFKKFLDDIHLNFKNQIFIAHNLKFDVAEIYKYCSNLRNFNVSIRNNKLYLIEFEITNKKKETKKIKFIDSMNFFNCSLEVLTKNNYKYYKQFESYTNIKNIEEIKNMDDVKANFFELQKYNMLDCFWLMEAMQIFRNNLKKNYKFDVFLNCISAWGMGRKIYYNNYYENNIDCLWYKLNKKILPTYFGGRNEAFYIGTINKNILKLDINWSYPARMVDSLIPWIYKQTIKNINYNKNLFGFVKVIIKSNFNNNWLNKVIPVVGIHDNGKLIFPIFEEYTKVKIFSEELHYILENNYYELKDNKILTYYEFEGTRCFEHFITDIYNKRLQAKKEYNEAYWDMLKVIMNSSYGCFGIKNESTNSIIGNNKQLLYYLLQGNLKNYEYLDTKKEDDINNVFLEFTKLTNYKFQNIAVASAITSYARLFLHKTMQKITDMGYNVFYCDTDSIFTDIPKNELLDENKKWITSIIVDPNILGAWKIENEIEDKSCEIYGLKMYSYIDPKKTKKIKKYNYNYVDLKNGLFTLKFESEIKKIGDEDIECNIGYREEIEQPNIINLTMKGHKNIKKLNDNQIQDKIDELNYKGINIDKHDNYWFKCNIKDIIKGGNVEYKESNKLIQKKYFKGEVLPNGIIIPFTHGHIKTVSEKIIEKLEKIKNYVNWIKF